MKRRYILYRRKRGGMFYIEDTETRKQESTGTRNRAEATSLLNARNESIRQPHLNLQIAKAYLAGTDSGIATRTWQQALEAIIETKSGPTQDRWRQAAKQAALDLIRHRVILETQGEHLLACLKAGTVSTNVHLRKLHNFCLSMNWLPWPIIPKRLWPEVRFKERRAITSEEHQLIIGREKNPERRRFYELCWHLGGSQTDIANLKAEDIDWPNQTIAYARQKTGSLAMIHFGPDIEAVLRQMPVKNDGYDTDKISGGGRPETPDQNGIPEMLRQWKVYKDSGFKTPPGMEAGALLPSGTAEAKCWWAKISTIAENEYNLGAGRYKPQVGEKPPDEDAAELISKTLKLERDIASGLEKLLKDVEAVK